MDFSSGHLMPMDSRKSQVSGSVVVPITPFRFQSVAVDVCEAAVGKKENLLLVSPTGTGKSVMIAMLFQRVMYLLGLRTVVVTSRDEIRSGILKCMVRVGVPLREAKLRVLTPQQFNNRLSRGLRGGGGGMAVPDLLIYDECLAAETPVLVPGGSRAIGELAAGDLVATPYGSFTRVVRVWRTEKEAVRLRLKSGREVVCSADHQWLGLVVRDRTDCAEPPKPAGLRRASKVVADRVRAVDAHELRVAPQWVVSAALDWKRPGMDCLYGWFLGDGCYPVGARRIQFGFRKDVAAFLSFLRDALGLVEGTDYGVHVNARGDTTIRLSRAVTAELVSRYEISRGPKTATAAIHPRLVAEGNLDVLRGLFSAEGYRGDRRILFDVTSSALAKQVAEILRMRGMEPTFAHLPSRRNPNAADRWRVSLFGWDVNRFNAQVGWTIPRKDQPLRSWGRTRKEFAADPVVSLEQLGVRELVDIEVEDPDHWFVLANGLVTSNCHHLVAPTWKHPISLGDLQHIGFTATPIRGDENETPELRAMFQRSYEAITIVQAIIDGYLVPPYLDRTAAGFLVAKPGESDRQQLALMEAQMMARIGEVYDLVEERERCRERRTLFAASSLPEAQAIVQYWRTKGRRVEYIDGRQRSRNLRREILRRFDAGEAWLVGVDIITEGIDLPSASRLVISRRSTALTPYAQLLGRGIRPWRDESDTARLDWKPDCEVLDLTDNFPRFRRMLETHFGLRFRAYPKVWAPDLEYDGRRAALAVSDEQHTTYDYRRVARRAAPPQGFFDGKVVTGLVGAASGTDNWAVDVDLGGGKRQAWMLAGGRWVPKRVQVNPVEYEVLIGGRRDLALRMAARLAGSVGVAPSRVVFLGDLLLWSLLQVQTGKISCASDASDAPEAIPPEVSRFLSSLTSPAGVARRTGGAHLHSVGE